MRPRSAENGGMAAALLSRVPALVAFVVVAVLATATLTLAATTGSTPVPATPAAAPTPATTVVPEVRRQAFVFAKGTLEQAGFAWRVVGPVRGYAANQVVSQSPAPGTRIFADGAPTITLTLARNSAYKQEGLPEDASSYPGTRARPVASKAPNARKATHTRRATPTTPKPAAKKPARTPAAVKAARKPAFSVPGAPPEPQDEIALPLRVKRLAAWLDSHRKPTRANVNHWLYQHNWVVTGAGFGWSGGTEALRALVAVDRRVQRLWGIGRRSERLARATLAEVETKAR